MLPFLQRGTCVCSAPEVTVLSNITCFSHWQVHSPDPQLVILYFKTMLRYTKKGKISPGPKCVSSLGVENKAWAVSSGVHGLNPSSGNRHNCLLSLMSTSSRKALSRRSWELNLGPLLHFAAAIPLALTCFVMCQHQLIADLYWLTVHFPLGPFPVPDAPTSAASYLSMVYLWLDLYTAFWPLRASPIYCSNT